MPNTVLVGAQWGDEGKGKIIDVLTEDVDVVARYQGGNNAGHTVVFEDKLYVLHLVPSGILRPGKRCVIGNGVVVDPLALLKELDGLKEQGVETEGRFFLSNRAHVVFPFHGLLDSQREKIRSNNTKIGTTKRGIGPCYADKAARQGLRMANLVADGFAKALETRIEETNSVLQALGADPIEKGPVVDQFATAAQRLKPYVTDTIRLLNTAVEKGESILFEGAQGTMLDIDFGTYPFVTSSSATAGGACCGTGVAPHRIDRVVGVVKAYTTRVGEGPFPTELDDDHGRSLGERGREFGATTGRPRRCGWFDAVIARYSAMLNGTDFWAMTKLDVLDSFETIKICTGYELNGQEVDTVPANIEDMAACKPVYEEMEGWMTPTDSVTRFEDLPKAAVRYVNRLCELTGVELGILSVGAGRENTLRINV